MIPNLVFIVPYRDRKPQKKVFECVMSDILKGENYKIFFIHQNDKRPFNRGAIKNLGFLYIKNIYPKDYKNITIVFHDIDFLPYYKNQFDYNTNDGVIKHFFGYKNTLGGMVSIKACDFEKINGFPNIWTWGLEDNILQKRCKKAGFKIDRSNFLHGGKDEDKIITLWHGWDRLINKKIGPKLHISHNMDGYSILKQIKWNTQNISEKMEIVNITHFETGESHLNATIDAKFLNSRYNQVFSKINTQKKLNKKKGLLQFN